MVRNRRRSTEKVNEENMTSAIDAVNAGSSVNGAAKKFGIARETLRQRVLGRKTKSAAHVGQRVSRECRG